jgi:hypothetical protein
MKTPIMLNFLKCPFLPLIAMAPLKISQPPYLIIDFTISSMKKVKGKN